MAWLGPGGPKVPENRTNTNHQSPFPALSFSGANCAVKRSFTRGNRAEFFGRLSSVLLLCYEDCARLLKSTSYGSPGIIKRFQAANVLENGVASSLDWRGDFRSLSSESLVSRAACCQTAQFPAKFIGFCARFARKIHNSGMRCTVSYHCDECSIIPRHKRRNWRAFLSLILPSTFYAVSEACMLVSYVCQVQSRLFTPHKEFVVPPPLPNRWISEVFLLMSRESGNVKPRQPWFMSVYSKLRTGNRPSLAFCTNSGLLTTRNSSS